MDKAQQVAEAFTKKFPDCKDYSSRPSIESVEEFMRPFAPISYETQHQIDQLLREKGLTSTGLHCWWEANFAVSGNGPHHEHALRFLIMDLCTCVVPHLPDAIDNATNEVDKRLIALRKMWEQCSGDEIQFHKLLKR